MKITAISDTHTQHKGLEKQLEGGDVLIFAGDLMGSGYNKNEIDDFCKWFDEIDNYDFKLFIAGNHDRYFENNLEETMMIVNSYKNIDYLQDDYVKIQIGDGPEIKFWGSPWQPAFHNWAFNLPRGDALREKWNMIPKDIDVLITHGPPITYGDKCMNGEVVGCFDLYKKVEEIKPKYHIFGHIHEGYGIYNNKHTTFINASVLNQRYERVNNPINIEI